MTTSPATLRQILARQRAWAESRGIEFGPSDRTADWRDNLLHPLPHEIEQMLEASPLRPLGEPGKPAELARLQSTLAMVCNLFGPWSVEGSETLGRALGAASEPSRIDFHPLVAVAGTAGSELGLPDALLSSLESTGSSRPTALVASYAEPYDQPETRTASLDRQLSQILPGCAILADDHRASSRRFSSLPVARLLSCALSLTLQHGPRGFRLAYVWYDAGDPTSRQHRQEVDRFRMRVGGEVDFLATTWHELSSQLRAQVGCDERVDAFSRRYLAA